MGNCAPDDSMLRIPSVRLTAPTFNAVGIGDDVAIKNVEEDVGDNDVKLVRGVNVGVAEKEDILVCKLLYVVYVVYIDSHRTA